MKLIQIFILSLLVSHLQAQKSFCPDVDCAVAHPLLSNYDNSCIIGYGEIKFDAVSFPLEKVTIKNTEKQLTIEGKVTDIIYGIDNQNNATVLEVQRNYEQALKAAGFEILFSAFGRKNITARRVIHDTYPSFGDVDFMESLACLQEKNYRFAFSSHNSSQDNDFAYFLASGKKEGKEYTMGLHVMYNRTSQEALNGNIFVQAKIVEVEAMDTDQVSAASIDEQIEHEGKEVFHNILFDFGSATLTEESYEVIAVLGDYLSANPEKAYFIVGHTDNVGSLAANQALSEQRAAAVLKVLTSKHGVLSSQVTAHGVGQLAPLAINTSEVGRALNRRVELVLK